VDRRLIAVFLTRAKIHYSVDSMNVLRTSRHAVDGKCAETSRAEATTALLLPRSRYWRSALAARLKSSAGSRASGRPRHAS
jgi:hypothetical protein